MRLTRFTDYGLRTLIYLALKLDSLASIAGIAAAYGISESHMTKVVHALGRAGVIETLRGRHGGLRLARPAAAIGLGDVVRAIEPELALVECQAGAHCVIGDMCRLRSIMDEASSAMLGALDHYTIAHIAGPRSEALLRRLGLSDALSNQSISD
jgi:Rrf2 family transcriptional regulator, nitric oxide-sensitive transcriptional repressor